MGTPLVDDELTYDESWAEALAVAVEMVASISQRMLASAEDFGDFFVDDWARSKVDAMMAGHTRYPPKAAPLLLTFFRQWWTTAHKATRTKLLDDLAGRLIIHLRGTATARAIIHSLIEDPRSDEEFNLIARLEGSCKMPSPETVMAIVLTCSRAQWRVKAWQSCGVMSEGLVEVCRKAVLYDPDAQVRPQALATCTCAHLVILALSEDDSGMIIHVESEILKRVEADSEQFLR
ncbi:hypothetical protein Pmar_PMAR029059 [Perkinsus marinus ATCC 50983]|uniref:Uncharacterized protein n=1 Tax=Perkinsus marinus (strain ATCC 50983 / TXsc) TaxID=423536 RepID=C5L6E0_PERM5|nr:hypothetical protein Pmar_PMAR029059 [Perkinsus marinus ATCC 50983]EER07767.1 hypothetical protein Pmar_PMAR029059 [Perkinsus marinus ATCC 50983]|eukprot:XP_002775951.1 hypothetical protein Pmar_PMAR029059 [Perkinsus marinus ATCC 50983]